MNTDDLKKQTQSGFAWDLGGSFLRQLATFVISIFLARLLSPEAFGIVGIAIAFNSILSIFVDVGFTDAIIQKREISDQTLSAVFFLNLGISLLVSAALYFLAPWISSFFDSKELELVLKLLSLVPVIAAFGKAHAAILARQMNFKALTIRDILATVFGGIVGVTMAWKGFNVFALVGQQLIFALTGTVLLWIGSKWRPTLRINTKGLKSLINFGIYVFFEQLVRRVSQKADTLFIGKFFSPADLGFYSRAESLNAQVMTYSSSSIRKVMFPVFSRIQDDEKKFKGVYFKSFQIAAVIALALSGPLYFLGGEIIIGLYGEKWAPSVIIFQILVFRLIFAPFGGIMGKSLLSKGFSKEKFQIGLLSRALMFTPIIIGFFAGLNWFVLAIVVASFLSFLINAWFVDRMINISFQAQLKIPLFTAIPLAILCFIHYFLANTIIYFSLFWTIAYLLIFWFFLNATKHPGFILLYREGKKVVGKLRNKH
ncbi:MAG: lipopolysaccharide biosynthesis protein [Mameliella sp.]|nr:lipopolysaccharide biosynthesis protein [Phaeodactylibacter sp.]